MIARLSYVMCDECGNAAEPADDAKETRAFAAGQGYERREGRDLCRRCALSPEDRAYEDSHAGLMGYQTVDGCDCRRCRANRASGRQLARDMEANYGRY